MEACGDDARERLLRVGGAALTDAELVTVLLGTGGRGGLQRAQVERLLAGGGGLRALLEQDSHELCQQPGLGPTRAAQVLAALELGRRVQRTAERRPRLRTPAEIDAYLRPLLSALRREVFHVLCFNARNVLVRDARVAEGTVNACPVDPREVFAVALAARATALVLAHNHPSGDPEPSALDVALTSQLVEGGRLLGIRVLDHLVVGDTGYVSLLERGLMPVADGGGRRTWSDGC
ncbi:MAG: DNA repair protein RadC [Myxococcaceae bacterium]|nr:DNA repair protein RadC [Myxococcaceae bacterium]MCI0670551.1 DNA repair protein RadC [Myxococcaceae bacterium]